MLYNSGAKLRHFSLSAKFILMFCARIAKSFLSFCVRIAKFSSAAMEFHWCRYIGFAIRYCLISGFSIRHKQRSATLDLMFRGL